MIGCACVSPFTVQRVSEISFKRLGNYCTADKCRQIDKSDEIVPWKNSPNNIFMVFHEKQSDVSKLCNVERPFTGIKSSHEYGIRFISNRCK